MLETDQQTISSVVTWTSPPVLTALITAFISLLGAILSGLGVLVNRKRMEIMEQQLAQARERDIATWMKDFQEYRKNHLKPLAETVSSAYAAFTQHQSGVPDGWANAVKYAEWPPDLPIPNGERLQSWKTRFGPRLTSHGDFLLRFAEAIYVPGPGGMSQERRKHSRLLTPEEFDVLDNPRQGVANYFDLCGMLAEQSAEFREFIDTKRANHFQNLKLVAYLELACARSLGENTQPGRGKVHLFQLGRRWEESPSGLTK